MTIRYIANMSREHAQKTPTRLMNVWMPEELFPHIDRGVRELDLDRSKFVRQAIREKLEGLGINCRPESSPNH
jgi:hypothetical protein